jgi:hypothetical protein
VWRNQRAVISHNQRFQTQALDSELTQKQRKLPELHAFALSKQRGKVTENVTGTEPPVAGVSKEADSFCNVPSSGAYWCRQMRTGY